MFFTSLYSTFTSTRITTFVGTTNTLCMPSACFLKPYGFPQLSNRSQVRRKCCTHFNFKDIFFFNMASRNFYFFICATAPQWARASLFTTFLDHTQRHTTVGRTPLDERLAGHTDLYLTTHNTHSRQTSMPPVVFEPRSQQASGCRLTP